MKKLLTLVCIGGFALLALVYEATQPLPSLHSAPVHSVARPGDAPLCQAKQDFPSVARCDAQSVGINPTLFVRQIQVESGFNPNAVSYAGAIGIAQFMPTTAKGLGINPRDPYASLKGAARLMASYVKRYGEYAKALAAYNAGSGRLAYALSHCGVQWRMCLPMETQRYILAILR